MHRLFQRNPACRNFCLALMSDERGRAEISLTNSHFYEVLLSCLSPNYIFFSIYIKLRYSDLIICEDMHFYLRTRRLVSFGERDHHRPSIHNGNGTPYTPCIGHIQNRGVGQREGNGIGPQMTDHRRKSFNRQSSYFRSVSVHLAECFWTWKDPSFISSGASSRNH